MKIIISKLFLVMLIGTASAQVPLNYSVENRGVSCKAPAMTTKNNTKLPDPFAWEDGSGRISSMDDWSCRRNEIKAELETYEIGPKPAKPTVTATYSGGKLNISVTVGSNTIQLTPSVTMPSGTGPFPVAIGMGTLGADFSGCVQVIFTYGQVVNLNYNGTRTQSDPFYKLYPELWNKIGNYSAWSWGVSRIIDGLELCKDQMKCNMSKIAVMGCSAAGKMALFAGALDERVTLTIAQESGGGGIPAWRVSKKLSANGYDCERIENTNYSWFLQSMKTLDPNSLPHDHHELIAMIAPRAFLALGNHDYNTWLCDQGGYISCLAAHEVWKAMGVGDRFGYDFSGAHEHCSAASSQKNSCKAFIDKFLKDNTSTSTAIAIFPPSPKENISTWKDWTTPTLSASPVVVHTAKIKTTSTRCFVNRIDSKINIDSYGPFSYMLLNEAGQMLESGSAVNKTVINRVYPDGVYFIKVNQQGIKTVSRVVTVK